MPPSSISLLAKSAFPVIEFEARIAILAVARHIVPIEDLMARPKKTQTAGAATVAAKTHPESTANRNSTLPVAAINTYFPGSNAQGNKRKGKEPGKKTLLVRAGLAEYPHLPPKQLADVLNERHPDFHFKNMDVSQQKLQLRYASEKKSAPKAQVRQSATVAAAPTPVRYGSELQRVADLAKTLGTANIRELCDLIDYLSK
jgi:hypothetical protein